MPTPISSVLKAEAFLGIVRVNHLARGYTYHFYIPATDIDTAINKLVDYVTKLQFVIPIGSTIVDAVVYQPDSDKYGEAAIAQEYPSRAVDIIVPDEDADPDSGFVPNDVRTCLLINLITAGWSGREFFRTPPDVYIADQKWVGPAFANITSTTAAIELTANTSTSPTKVNGTWVERVRELYKYVFDTFQYEWRPHPTDDNSIQISAFKKIQMRRVTQHVMGRAFLPDRRK